MADQDGQVSWASQMRWALPGGAMVAVLVFSAMSGAPSHEVVTALARLTAVLLLFFVARASMEMGHRWLVFARHDSIRADIAAAGGLGKRLSV